MRVSQIWLTRPIGKVGCQPHMADVALNVLNKPFEDFNTEKHLYAMQIDANRCADGDFKLLRLTS